MLLLLSILISIVASRPAVVHFRHQLTPSFVRRIERVVEYECTEYVHPNGLLLFVNTQIEEKLNSHFTIRSIEPLAMRDRCSPTLSSFGRRGEFNHISLPRARMDGSGHQEEDEQSTTPPTKATLRVLLHPGAFVEKSAEDWHNEIVDGIDDSVSIIESSLLHVTNVAASRLTTVAEELMHLDCVCYVEIAYEPHLLNMWSSATAQALDTISDASASAADACGDCHVLWDAGIRGEDQLVAISDTGISTGMCYFNDPAHTVPTTTDFSPIPVDTLHRKIRAYWNNNGGGDFIDTNGHGTHVSGTAVGSSTGVSDGSGLDATDFNGIAPDARVVFIDGQIGSSSGISLPYPYDTQLLQFAYNAGARVHSGSWGVSDFVYSDEDRRIDRFCWLHRTFLAVFAAGNSGGSAGAASILSPALAKNAFAVGAAMNGFASFDIASGSSPTHPPDSYAYDWLADFSSRGGSALDVSWMKPDIVGAGGRWIWSAANDGATNCAAGAGSVVLGLAGTSMAAPQVAGAALLIRNYFMGGFYHSTFEPTASLLKALFAASATPLRGVFPNVGMSTFDASSTYAPYGRGYLQGHGRFSIASVLPLMTRNDTSMVVLANEHVSMSRSGQTHRYCVQVHPPNARVAIALAYTDYPSSVGSSNALVNDLDLRVHADGSSVYPNNLPTRDGRSPLEVLHIVSSSGNLQVEVTSHSVNFEIQSYSLVVTAFEANSNILVNGVSASSTPINHGEDVSGSCSLCNDLFVEECIECGNGVIEGTEECDPETPEDEPCCNPSTCQFISDSRECFAEIVDRECFVSGTCSGGTSECTIDTANVNTVSYVLNGVECTDEVSNVTVCSFDVLTALTDLTHIREDDRVCCRTFHDVAEHAVDGSGGLSDPLFEQLAQQLVAALINFRRSVPATGQVLVNIDASQNILAASCVSGEISIANRPSAASLIDSLDEYNAGTCPSTIPPPISECSTPQQRANAQYCSSSGVFNFDTSSCECVPSRHAHDNHCDALHCSAHGASIRNAQGTHECICLIGWSGVHCASCAPAPRNDVEYVCVGLDRALIPTGLEAHTHVLTIVAEDTIAARLADSFYDSSIDKARDVLPGSGAHDCWCATATHHIVPDDFASHAEALEAANNYVALREALYALAAPAVNDEPSPPPPTPAPTNTAKKMSVEWCVVFAFLVLFV